MELKTDLVNKKTNIMDDILIEKINIFVKDKCSRVPHNIGLDILKIVNRHQEALTTSSVIVPKGTFVCDHPKPYKNTPWGYKVCEKCNDIVEREQTNAL